MKKGWIYALSSETCQYIKIGLTTTSPAQRIGEINGSVNYGPLGPWQQLDIRQVKDVTRVETTLHRKLNTKRVTTISSVTELFDISQEEGRAALASIPDADLNTATPLNKLKLEPDFISYLLVLFRNSGLENFRDIQESWTFSLFPKTGGGRFFTLNIDRHEVAFSQPSSDCDQVHLHSIVVDSMVNFDRELKRRLKPIGGRIRAAPYPSNWGNAVTVDFEATFEEAAEIFEVAGFRRALVAYWYDALLRMQEKETRSLFARFHNYNATSEIFRHLRETKRFRTKLA